MTYFLLSPEECAPERPLLLARRLLANKFDAPDELFDLFFDHVELVDLVELVVKEENLRRHSNQGVYLVQ